MNSGIRESYHLTLGRTGTDYLHFFRNQKGSFDVTKIAKKSQKPESGVLVKQYSYTTGQLARVFDVAPRTISKWADKGQLTHYRIPGGQDRRFTFDAVVEFARVNALPLTVEGEDNPVLLVTANPDLAVRFQCEFEVCKCGFECVADWLTAGYRIARLRYDAVVIDAAMGRGTVIRACAAVKQLHPDAPVVVLVYEDETNPKELISHGASMVAESPFDVQGLVRRLVEPGE